MLAPQFVSTGFQPRAHFSYDILGRHGNAGLLESRPSRVRARFELHLHPTVLHRLPHGGFKEIGQCLAFAQNVFKISTKLGLDTDLRQDGGLHCMIVLQTCCRVKGPYAYGPAPSGVGSG